MSILVPFNGSNYLVPTTGETGWATPVSNLLSDLGNNAATKATAAITGGAINSTTIGATTPSTGAFTSLTATSLSFSSGALDNTVIGGVTPAAGTFTSVNTGQVAGLRNQIINGSFDVWQRGTLFSSTPTSYVADRWVNAYDGSGSTFAIARSVITWQPLLDLGFSYSLTYNQTVAGSGGTTRSISQRIENVRTLSGRTITVSAWLWASSLQTVNIQVTQYFGSGGSPSAAVVVGTTAVNITTTPTLYTATFSVPSIVGKTIGSNGDSALWLYFLLPTNSTFNILTAAVQVESGPVATPFEWRPPQVEFALCQRYYQIGFMRMVTYQAAASGIGWTQGIPVTMRTAPNMTPTFTTTTNCTSAAQTALDGDTLYTSATATALGPVVLFGSFIASAEL